MPVSIDRFMKAGMTDGTFRIDPKNAQKLQERETGFMGKIVTLFRASFQSGKLWRENRAVMKSFFHAIKREYGAEAERLAKLSLGSTYKAGGPLTSYKIQKALSDARIPHYRNATAKWKFQRGVQEVWSRLSLLGLGDSEKSAHDVRKLVSSLESLRRKGSKLQKGGDGSTAMLRRELEKSVGKRNFMMNAHPFMGVKSDAVNELRQELAVAKTRMEQGEVEDDPKYEDPGKLLEYLDTIEDVLSQSLEKSLPKSYDSGMSMTELLGTDDGFMDFTAYAKEKHFEEIPLFCRQVMEYNALPKNEKPDAAREIFNTFISEEGRYTNSIIEDEGTQRINIDKKMLDEVSENLEKGNFENIFQGAFDNMIDLIERQGEPKKFCDTIQLQGFDMDPKGYVEKEGATRGTFN